MKYETAFFVYGVKIDFEQFVSIFRDDLRALRGPDESRWDPESEEWKKHDPAYPEGSIYRRLCEVIDICDGDYACDIHCDFLDSRNYVFFWWSTKEYVVGIKACDLNNECSKFVDTPCSVEEIVDDSVKERWKEMAVRLGLEDRTPSTYIHIP